MTLKQKLEARCKELGIELEEVNYGQQVSVEVYSETKTIDGEGSIYLSMNNVKGAMNNLREAMLETLSPENHCEIKEI